MTDRDSIFKRVVEHLSSMQGRGAAEITPQTSLREDLDLNSLDAVDLVLTMEEEFGVELPDEELVELQVVADVVEAVASRTLEQAES